MQSASPSSDHARASATDLANCAREPIHIPGSIQPYGMLLVLGAKQVVEQAAVAPECGIKPAELLGRRPEDVIDGWDFILDHVGAEPTFLGNVTVGSRSYQAVAHRSGERTIVELESNVGGASSFEELYPLLRSFLSGIDKGTSVDEIGELAAREVRRLTEFDRTLIYRFDEEWSGLVIAEDRNDRLPSYLDLRFPAADIPAQARDLYRRNKLRLIADADYAPVPLEPATGEPVDLSLAMLRSVSPVHLEYMRNMETWASMSISLLVDDRLWGLISCHSREPKRVGYHVRNACDFMGQILSLQISAREHSARAQARVDRREIHADLLTRVAGEADFVAAMAAKPEQLLGITDASGAAILFDEQCLLIGETAGEPTVRRIAEWLSDRPDRGDLFETNRLGELMPDGEAVTALASGLLAISVSQVRNAYIMWFRPEVIRTVRWGGDPRKPAPGPGDRLSPRTSFEAWRETVRNQASPWTPLDREMAVGLRTSVVDIVLRKAEEMAALNEQLVRSNKELEAFSYSVSHDLRAPFRHIVGYSELLLDSASDRLDERDRRYVSTIVDSAKGAGRLVDSLLNFSQMGRASLGRSAVDMNLLVADCRARLDLELGERNIEWRVEDLPTVQGDLAMLQQVMQNLIGNAVKFTRTRDPAIISVEHQEREGEHIFTVRDNGCGFDMAYVAKLFGVFQRLHHADEFEGTGIGLANVRRVIERHGGRTWAEGVLDEGAAISFTLPILGDKQNNG
jgi:light-regulated signal transduction histidine kinase (bacteriophytochrome)